MNWRRPRRQRRFVMFISKWFRLVHEVTIACTVHECGIYWSMSANVRLFRISPPPTACESLRFTFELDTDSHIWTYHPNCQINTIHYFECGWLWWRSKRQRRQLKSWFNHLLWCAQSISLLFAIDIFCRMI